MLRRRRSTGLRKIEIPVRMHQTCMQRARRESLPDSNVRFDPLALLISCSHPRPLLPRAALSSARSWRVRLALRFVFGHGLGAFDGALFYESLLSRTVDWRLRFVGNVSLGDSRSLTPGPPRFPRSINSMPASSSARRSATTTRQFVPSLTTYPRARSHLGMPETRLAGALSGSCRPSG